MRSIRKNHPTGIIHRAIQETALSLLYCSVIPRIHPNLPPKEIPRRVTRRPKGEQILPYSTRHLNEPNFFLLSLPGLGSIFLPAEAAASTHSTTPAGSGGGRPQTHPPRGYVMLREVTTRQSHPKIGGRNNAKGLTLLVKTGIVRFAKQTAGQCRDRQERSTNTAFGEASPVS